MNSYFLIGLLLPLAGLVSKYVSLAIVCIAKRSVDAFRQNDFTEDVIMYFILASFFSFAAYLLLTVETASEVIIYGVALAFISLAPVCNSIFIPLLALLRRQKNLDEDGKRLTERTLQLTGQRYPVYVSQKNILNAFASGVLPFSKIIVFGKPLLEKLDSTATNGILCHEVAHLKKHHLLKMLLVNLLWIYITFGGFLLLRPAVPNEYMGWFVGLYYGLMAGGGSVMLLGRFQKKLELEADQCAAEIVGTEEMRHALLQLNEVTGNEMETWSWNYPRLSERINALRKSA